MVPYSKQVMMVGGGGDQDNNKKGISSNEVIDIKPVVEEINCNDNRGFGIINLAEPLLEPIVVKPVTSNNSNMKQHHHHSSKFQVKYKECMKNHAASIGGHANDGCGEFMQEADQDNNNNNNARSLRCAACGCHRNFHRKEIHGSGFVDHLQQQVIVNYNGTNPRYEKTKKHHHHHQSRGGFNSLPSLSLPQVHNNNQQFLVQHRSSKNNSPINNNNIRDALFGDDDDNTTTMDYNNEDRRSETPEERVGMMRNGGSSSNNNHNGSSNKRFRTKFSQEQKDKMLDFADKIGWRIQKQDDNALNQFCLEIGVKRQVLKVWMHNNKNTLRKPQQLLGTSSSSVALPTSSSVPAAAPVVMQLQSPPSPSPSSPAAQHHQHHHHHQQHPRSINGV
ncbi:hypothetical protein MKX03_023451 [Papaver bracteatum]|nr:hypothetical protein MKX03_023451 [Papaver bracteatum]